MSKRKKNSNEYCHGCLTKDRPLVSIDSYYHIFLKLVNGEIDNIGGQVNVPKMCWECRAALRNSEKFLQNVKKAHEFLTGRSRKMVQVKSLSKLSTVFINYYDLQEIHEDFDINNDLKPNDFSDKIEININLKLENLSNDMKSETDGYGDNAFNDIKEEPLEIEQSIKQEQDVQLTIHNNSKVKDRKKLSRIKSFRSKYKVICLTEEAIDARRVFKRVQIDDKERLQWLERIKVADDNRNLPYKCKLCISDYAKKAHYDRHVTKFHSKSSGKFECDMCKKRYEDKNQLIYHIREHYVKYVCLLCNYENYRSWKVRSHFATHKRAVMCLTCGLKFERYNDFYQHYRRLHHKVICDYCGKKWNNKNRLIKHISKRHNKHRCEICNRSYTKFEGLVRHNKLNHVVSRNEESYCVECNIQFENIFRYRLHLTKSVKHKTYVGVPCPVCNKVYRKRYAMNNHYRFVHLKKTPYYCEKCSKYFLHSYRLRQHIERVHEKIPAVKDKICPHCSHAFSSKQSLNNHIRTHTGERPFVCEVCLAKFAQKTALVVHQRARHKLKK